MKKNKQANGIRFNGMPRCSFCGRSTLEGVDVVVGPNGTAICGECAKRALSISNGEKDFSADSNPKRKHDCHSCGRNPAIKSLPTPSQLVKILDEYVVGQDDVKKTLATAVYNHYSRIMNIDTKREDDDLKDVHIEKSNIVMVGPTGCGKTLLAKTLAKVLNVPFAIADATTLTEAGYVGEDVENVVRYLYNNADGDIEKTQVGIVWLDELDKIASKTQNVSLTRDVSGEGVQQALLKIIEGTTCRFPPKGGRKHPDQEYVEVDTSNILFIGGGAFVGLDNIVENRIKKSTSAGVIGFGAASTNEKSKNESRSVRPEDLVEFGLIPEFVGRLPIIAEMKELTEDELLKVLTVPKNSLAKQYKKLLRSSGINLEYSEDALRQIARRAIERNTGARGLRAEMESVMKEIMFNAPDNKENGKLVVITKEIVDAA